MLHGCACSFACVHERFVRCACDVRAFALVRCADRTCHHRGSHMQIQFISVSL